MRRFALVLLAALVLPGCPADTAKSAADAGTAKTSTGTGGSAP